MLWLRVARSSLPTQRGCRFGELLEATVAAFQGKIFIIIAVFIASLWAPFIERFPTLWEYLQALLSYLSPPVVTCFIFGLFWQKSTARAAFTSLCMGSLLALILIINNYFFSIIAPIHYLYSATVIFVFSSVIMILVSLLFPDETGIEPIGTRDTQITTGVSEQAWYKRYELSAVVVCLLCAFIVVLFW
jgi:SSS family solute:Na+ symporter